MRSRIFSGLPCSTCSLVIDLLNCFKFFIFVVLDCILLYLNFSILFILFVKLSTKITKYLSKGLCYHTLMSDNQFVKLFTCLQKISSGLKAYIENSKKEHADIRRAITEVSAQVKSYHKEMIFLTRKINRLVRWVHEIADRNAVRLSKA